MHSETHTMNQTNQTNQANQANPTSEGLTTQALFTQYLSVVNRALGEHRDEFPYKQLVKMGAKIVGERRIGVEIYKDDPDHAHDAFTVRFDDGTFDLIAHGLHGTDRTWKIRERHLRNVVDGPSDYIEHPAKLDLDWLRTRVSMN